MSNESTPGSGGSRGLRVRLGSGFAWNLLGAAFNQGSTFALNLFLSHAWGLGRFGEYAMIQSTVATVAMIAQLATGYTATKYVAEHRSTDRERTGRILGLCLLLSAAAALLAAILLAVGARWLMTDLLRAPALTPEMRIAAAIVPSSVLAGYLMGALAGLEAFPALGRAGVAAGLVYFVLGSLGAWAAGLRGLLIGLAASGVLQMIILRVALRRAGRQQNIAVSYAGVWRERRIVTRFALPATMSGAVSLTALWFSSAILARQPKGYEHLAIYAAANNIRIIIPFIPTMINAVGMAVLNNALHEDDGTRYRRVFWATAGLTAVSVLTGAAAVALAGPWVLGLFGQGFRAGSNVLGVLMVAAVLEALFLSVYQVVQSRAALWLSFFAIVLPRDGSTLLAASLLVPARGAVGLAEALALGRLLSLVVVVAIVSRLGLRASPPPAATPAVVDRLTWP